MDKQKLIDRTLKRFWERVDKKSKEDCWNWLRSKDTGGYGQFWFLGKNIRASRYSWIVHNGGISNNLWVLHKCDNPACCNPNHLFLGTNSDNIKDSYNKGRSTQKGRNTHPTKKVN